MTALVAFVVACAPVPAHPSLRTCASFGVRAIRRHVVVSAAPPACAGLTRAQVNQAVGIAIREAVGSQPKAAGRHLAVRDGRYLAPLVRQVPPPPPAALGTSASSRLPAAQLTWSALACWLATAAVGAYLLFGQSWHRRHRDRRPASPPPRVAVAHAAVALAGLAVCIAFAITRAEALGWTAAALIAAAAGLGMASLVTFLPEPAPGPLRAGTGWTRSLVITVAGHGLLATVTMLLVVLAAISRS